MTPDLPSLAYRVETEPPSQELQSDIALAVGWRLLPSNWGWKTWICPSTRRCAELPPWLTSIDAAASLMPEGWLAHVFQYNTSATTFGDRCLVYGLCTDSGLVVGSRAPTEPLARTAAALRAQAQTLASK
jgi:hypothetical protein